MKRLCFDIACNAVHHYTDGWLSTYEQAYPYFMASRTPVTFHAATAIVEESCEVLTFTDPDKLSDCLAGIDELVTFNGTVYDLPVLSVLVGADKMQTVLEKPHHDIQHSLKALNIYKLETAARDLLGVGKDVWKRTATERKLLTGSAYTDFLQDHLSETYRDAFFTLALFRHLQTVNAG